MVKIGEAARQAGISTQAIRFYERNKLMGKPKRLESGYRAYDEEDLKRLRFIKNAKDMGFTLKEIRELLELKMRPGGTCAEIKKKAVAKLFELDRRIKEMTRLKKALAKVVDRCSAEASLGKCPILDAMQ